MQLEPDAEPGIHAVHFQVTKAGGHNKPGPRRSLAFVGAEADPNTLRFAVCLNNDADAVELVEVDYDAAVAAAKFDRLVDDLAATTPGSPVLGDAEQQQPAHAAAPAAAAAPQSPEQLLGFAAALLQRARAAGKR